MRLLILLALTLAPLFASGDAGDTLSARLAQLHALSGRFEQLQYSQQGDLSAESAGQFRLLVPGYFAWDIQSPDSQLLIADPEFLWHYDRDLETVTRRPVNGPERATPLQVLGGNAEELQGRFEVSAGSDSSSFLLVPLAKGQGFESIELTFHRTKLSAMTVLDSLGQRIEIRFSELDETPLGPEDFAFAPPTDADLFIYDE